MRPSVDSLLRKYDVAAPRYTSYPAVPFWKSADFDASGWAEIVRRTFSESNDKKGIRLDRRPAVDGPSCFRPKGFVMMGFFIHFPAFGKEE